MNFIFKLFLEFRNYLAVFLCIGGVFPTQLIDLFIVNVEEIYYLFYLLVCVCVCVLVLQQSFSTPLFSPKVQKIPESFSDPVKVSTKNFPCVF